jgi:hypothetical protein
MAVRFLSALLSGLILFVFSSCVSAETVVERGENGNWVLYVDGKPYFVKGMEYSPDPARTYPEINGWMHADKDGNEQVDAAYDSWVDVNNDNFRDADEDTIRIYHSDNLNVPLLRDLFDTYGIRVIMGNFLGAYTIASGAQWCDGTDYTDPQQCRNMKENIRAMVEENKDEPYLLMYMLGNENDAVGSADNSTLNNTNAVKEPEAFAKFVNDVCVMIKKMDPAHPVGICLATNRLLPYLAEYAPDVDIIGMNAYTGPFGFDPLWRRVKTTFDRPVLITEFGTDCYNLKKQIVDEEYQAYYHKKCWQDIEKNSFWGTREGNAIGGVFYCWMDKWWLIGASRAHDTDLGARPGPNRGGYYCDEWFGACGQGDGTNAPFMRQLRKTYGLYRDELWKKSLPFEPDYIAHPSLENENAQ